MNTLTSGLRAILCALVVGLALGTVVGLAATGRAPAGPQGTKVTQGTQAATPPPPEAFAGDDTCTTCHESEGKSLGHTRHGQAQNPRTPAARPNRACESCHGPGREHAETGDKTKIVLPTSLPPREAADRCLTCHTRSTHAMWKSSTHDLRNLSCVTCHSVHTPKGPYQLRAKTEIDMCATCHRNVVNRQYRFNHMPVREGALTCSSCHNPHGSINVRMLKVGTTIDESCTSCHAEKRGPYLWEHAPVANSCATCHEPHGSNNERMLVAKRPFLCQRCHVTSRHPPTVYDGYVLGNSTNANKIIGRSCTVCHQQIHGSNAPSGQFFLR